MRSDDWSDWPLVEMVPGKASGEPLRKDTRLPVDAITGNYDTFLDEGLSPSQTIAEKHDCYPEAGIESIEILLRYRVSHEFRVQT